jgi:undecaprenyl-diphosphatase
LDLFQVILQGIVEGLTEFIPVSSTGHLILLASYLESHDDKEKLFEVFIQLGAILAVAFIYFDKLVSIVRDLLKEGLKGKGTVKGVTLSYDAWDILIACIPPLFAGFFLYKYIKTLLFYPYPVACALIFGGILLILVEKIKPEKPCSGTLETVSRKQALMVGLFQCMSLWPGMSRSGSCIIGGRFWGLSRVLSAEFSFIVAIPIMTAAVTYDVYKSYHILELGDWWYFIIGFVVSFIAGGVAVKGLISYLTKYSLVPIGVYRILLGITVLWYFA